MPAARRPRVRRGYLPTESEAAFQQKTVQFAKYCGWMDYHTFDSRRSARGFPDLVLVRGPRLVFAELKTDKGVLRPEQHIWLAALQEVSAAVEKAVGLAIDDFDEEAHLRKHGGIPVVEAHLWRPADWPEIERVLGR